MGLNNNELKWDRVSCGGQYLEDLATAYWYSEALFMALDLGVFSALENNGETLEVLSGKLNCQKDALHRFLLLLKSLSLVDSFEDKWFNTLLTSKYLIEGKDLYQGNSILWRKELQGDWKTLKETLQAGKRVHFLSDDESVLELRRKNYLKAMDDIVKLKVPEIISFFENSIKSPKRILDVGAGSGRFSLNLLDRFSKCIADVLDIRQVLPHTESLINETHGFFKDRINYIEQNILEEEWNLENKYDLIVLSNIVHAYAEKENEAIIKNLKKYLSEDGLIIIHDFFAEHCNIKANFSDINMLINTYNGKVFKGEWISRLFEKENFYCSAIIPLKTDTAVIFASKTLQIISSLTIDETDKIIIPIKNLGFSEVIKINIEDIRFSEFAKNKCYYGCDSSVKKPCKINDKMTGEDALKMVSSYQKAFLLKGEPATSDFQRKMLSAETLAFKKGFHKAFVFWSGPCSICKDCDKTEACVNRKNCRPSMEGSGIDVFNTVRNVGEAIKTLDGKDNIVNYYGLLLLD